MKRQGFAVLILLAVFAPAISGCYTSGSLTRNSPFYPISKAQKNNELSWSDFRKNVLPKLEAGVGRMTEEEVRALFNRDPDAEQDVISGGISGGSMRSVPQDSVSREGGALPSYSQGILASVGKPLVVRGLAYQYSPTNNKAWELPIFNSDTKRLENYLVMVAFHNGALGFVEMKKERDVWQGVSWTSKKLVEGVIQTAMYAAPGIALGYFLERASKHLGGSLERGSERIGGSIDGVSDAVNNLGNGKIDVNITTPSGTITLPGGGSISTPGGPISGTITR